MASHVRDKVAQKRGQVGITCNAMAQEGNVI